MWPNRVGGIAATVPRRSARTAPCSRTSPGVCYWWGWVPTCGLTALLSASALHQWYLPCMPVDRLAIGHRRCFAVLNLCGHRVGHPHREADRVRLGAAGLCVGVIPVVAGNVDWGAGRHVPPEDAVHRRLRRSHQRDGGPLPDRLRRARLRGRGLPRRRDARPRPQRAARDVRERRDGQPCTSSCCRWSGSACSAPTAARAATSPTSSGRPSRRCSAWPRRRRRSGSWCSTCSTARCSRWPARRARCRSSSEDGLLPRMLAQAQPPRRPLGRHHAHRRDGDRVPARRRSGLADRGGQLHLPDRHRPAERRGLAAAPQRARPAAALSGAARDDRARASLAAGVWAASTVLGFQQFGLPTVLFGLALAYSGSPPTPGGKLHRPPRRGRCRGVRSRSTSSSPAR